MNITKNPELRQRVFDTIRDSVVTEREGTHLSDCIYCTRKAFFRKKGMSPQPDDELCLMWLTGFAFQSYMFPLDKEQVISVDGINCTPDVMSGIEVKTTRGSSKRFTPESMVHWNRQILGYCKALNRLEYDLVVMFVCGNYAPPFPGLDCWHIQTTQEEVDENWLNILIRSMNLKIALETGIPPEPDCEDWEWEYCENIELCPDTNCANKKMVKGLSKKR